MTSEQTAVATTPSRGDFAPREVIKLGDYDKSRYNLLIAGAFTSQLTPFLVPVAREYQVDPDPEHGEVYVQEWTKSGGNFVPKSLALSALALSNLANVAGILEIPQASGRIDDGRDPGVCTYRSTGFMRLPDGQPIIRTRELTLELSTLFEEIETRVTKKGTENKWNGKPEPWKPEKIAAEIRKEQLLAKKFFHRKCETGAKARMHRVLMGIRSKYSPAEIARPFVLAAVVPDVNQPEMRERMLDQATSSIGMLFGGGGNGGAVGRPPRQLTAGATPSANDIAAAGDEGAATGNRPTPGELGEIVGVDLEADDAGADDAAGDDPSTDAGHGSPPPWAQPADTKAPAAAGTAAIRDLIDALRTTAEGSKLKGNLTKPQVARLQEITAGLDWDRETIPVLERAWGDAATENLTAAQANAIITAADSFQSVDDFHAAWKAAAAA